MAKMESMKDETVDGNYGSFAFRTDANRSVWKCFDSSDYTYKGIVDDFGRIVRVGPLKNMRGY